VTRTSIHLLLLLTAALISCSSDKSDKQKFRVETSPQSRFSQATPIAEITTKEIDEASGIVASKCQDGVFWTHNDAKNKDLLFAIDLSGNLRGAWKVKGADNDDWEDIATTKTPAGECTLYIGDIGDNKGERVDHSIYAFKEPQVSTDGTNVDVGNPLTTEPAQVLHYNYPAGSAPNAETLLVHPVSAQIYVLTKEESGPSVIYAVRAAFGQGKAEAQRIGSLTLPSQPVGQLTGGDISSDGRHVVLLDYAGGYELSLPDGESNFENIFSQPPVPFALPGLDHGEGICYTADGRSAIAVRDGKKSPILRLDLKS
jgi:hypothetical protein